MKPIRVRAEFLMPPGDAVAASVWVDYELGVVALRHDYPDLKPVAGWRVRLCGSELAVTGVDGRKLTVAE